MEVIGNDPRDKILLRAAENGDWTEIMRLHDEGMDIDKVLGHEYPFHGHITALSEASKHGHIECVQKLIELAAGRDDVYGLMLKYKCALEMAAVRRNLECFRLLVENRLFKAVGDPQKYKDFIDASRREDFDQIKKLLIGNVDRDILNGWKGNNLMSLFLMYGCPPSCLQVLIDQGVDINGFDYNGFIPLMCAVLTENVECVRFLLSLEVKVDRVQIYDPSYFLEDGTTIEDDEGGWGETALMYAACMNTECLRDVLQYYSDTNGDINFDGNDRQWSALFYAAYFGNTESVTLLLKSGAHLSGRDGFNYYKAPHYALFNGHADCLDILLKVASRDCISHILAHFDLCVSNVQCLGVLLDYIENLDDSCDDQMNKTYLMTAVNNGHLDSVRVLLEHGAGINFRNGNGVTAIMFSCDDQREEILDLLIKWGADINVANKEGDTSVMYAARNKAVKCLDKLMTHGANIHFRNKKRETALMIACASGHAEFVDLLMKSDADVKAENANRCTAVAYVSSVKCLQQLMDQGADIYVKDKKGRTALMFACEHGHYEVVDFLIQRGLDVNAQDGVGKTAIMYAADNCRDNCLKRLLNESADLNLVDTKGCTVFTFAMLRDGGCLDLLLHSGKLLCDGVLKPQHKHAVHAMKSTMKFSMKCLMLTMEFGIFEWGWCLLSHNLKAIAFAAVTSGISPGKFKYKGLEISLFLLAFIRPNKSVIKYLLANRYLAPEDFRVLSTDNTVRGFCQVGGTLSVMERLTAEPLSLRALSFLTVSKAVSLAAGPSGRTGVVEALPLPDRLKSSLQFKGHVSRVCPGLWTSRIGIDQALDEFNFVREEITFDEEHFSNHIHCHDCK